MERKMSLSCVVLTWNSVSYIDDCLHSIDGLKEMINLEVIVVDNGSTDGTQGRLFEFQKINKYNVEIILLDENMGTTITRNMAIEKCNGDFLAFIDSDVKFNSKGFLGMVHYLNDNEDVGILAPMIRYPDGSIQQSCKKFPTLDVKILKLIDIFTFMKSSNRDYYDGFPFNSSICVDTAISAFWLMRKDIINLVGIFDENIFYSPEDIDYCLRVWLAGKKVSFYPYFKAIHHTQQLTHRFPFRKISFSHIRGLLYYFNKYDYILSDKKIRSKLNINKTAPI